MAELDNLDELKHKALLFDKLKEWLTIYHDQNVMLIKALLDLEVEHQNEKLREKRK